MRRTLCLLAAVFTATAAFSTPAFAQRPNGPSFGAMVGTVITTGDIKEVAGTGWDVGALVNFAPPALPFYLRAEGSFIKLGSKDMSGIVDTNPTMLNFSINALKDFNASSMAVHPYVIAGLGFYSTRIFKDEERSNNLGVNVGGGIKFPVGHFGGFVDVRFHDIFSSGGSSQILPISFGIILQ